MKKILFLIIGILIVAGGVFWWFLKPSEVAISNQYKDLVILNNPKAGEYISSPVKIEGMARGNWFFEASFPVVIVDWDGLIIGEGIAQAQGEWMTSEYVPFKAEVVFTKPNVKNNGSIILRKDNPSGLPEYDDAFEVPVFFN